MTRRLRLISQVVVWGILLSGCLLNPAPVVTISMEPSSGYSPLLVHLEAHHVAAEPGPVSYEWKFGDGASAIGPAIDHEFTGKGAIPVHLIVTDAQGRQAAVDGVIQLLNRLPHAQFTYQPVLPPTHLPIHFDASESFDPDGEIVSYHWDFGDGATAVGLAVKHEFETPSIDYRIVFTVTDNSGDVNSTYRDLELIGCDH